ncbi:MAG: glycosyltransferase family 4 protein, partial [Clostridiaceae bacterium]|nr:glycosyltransferase family 4 protein [Clostridiaceae bacterium]
MRIAMLTSNYKPFVGGVPISIERLADGLRRRGHMVFVFAPECGDTRAVDDIFTYRFRTVRPLQRGGFRPSQLFDPAVGRLFPNLGADVIHVHDPFLVGQLGLRLGRRYGVPVVFTHHTRYDQYLHYVRAYAAVEARARDGHPLTAGLLREVRESWLPAYVTAFENRCDAVIAPSETLRQDLLGAGVQSPICVLPTGLTDAAFLRDEPASARLRKELLGGRKYLLCTVSRLGREKNLDILLRGMALLKERIGSSFRLVMIGEGPERAALESLRDRLGLTEEVQFPGVVSNDQLAIWHRACDLFVFASRSETQGIVLLEAMAAGRPVVALRASGSQDVVRDGENGLLTCEAELAPRIADVLTDGRLRRSLSGQALMTASHYTVCEVARSAEALYCELGGGALPLHPAPARRAAGLCPAPAPARRAAGLCPAPAPAHRAAGLCPAPAPTRRAAGLCPAPAPTRRAAGLCP